MDVCDGPVAHLSIDIESKERVVINLLKKYSEV
jgi:hypothetical protein